MSLKSSCASALSRRAFLGGVAGAAITATASPSKVRSLVPDVAGSTPNYWCTWGAQNYAVDRQTVLDAYNHSNIAAKLTENAVFGENGWARAFPQIHRDLYILFDLGWDVPATTRFDKARWQLGSQEVAVDKFPSCTGTPPERLRKLNEIAKRAGWRGAGLWIAAQAYGDGRDGHMLTDPQVVAFFRERLRWSHDAGIEYWKVDYGARGGADFRSLVTKLAKAVAPGLRVEHARGTCPLNDVRCLWEEHLAFHNTGGFAAWGDGSALNDSVRIASFSHVFRTYDVTAQLSTATTLDRAIQILAAVSHSAEATGIINCEDEPYIAAGLGLMMGIMRHPRCLTREEAGANYDPYNTRRRITEVTRAVRWQRLAPASAMNASAMLIDSQRLVDRWQFAKGDTWADWVIGTTVVQGAPARAARGLALPAVKGDELPFVIASRNPHGAVAVAALPRVDPQRGQYRPLADIALEVPADTRWVGVFGHVRKLSLQGLRSTKRVLAQDLAAEVAEDISVSVDRRGGTVTISGEALERLCRLTVPDDLSEPGVVLEFI